MHVACPLVIQVHVHSMGKYQGIFLVEAVDSTLHVLSIGRHDYNRQIKIRQNFLLVYTCIRMAIPY